MRFGETDIESALSASGTGVICLPWVTEQRALSEQLVKERGTEGPEQRATGRVPLAPCHDGDGGQNAHPEISLLSLAGSLGTPLLLP